MFEKTIYYPEKRGEEEKDGSKSYFNKKDEVSFRLFYRKLFQYQLTV